MSNFFKEFQKPGFNSWKEQLIADLKGKDASILERLDAIEEIDFSTYQHEESVNVSHEIPGEGTHIRGEFDMSNSWQNIGTVLHKESSVTNKKALELLNSGADAIRFIFEESEKESQINFEELLNEIQQEYIHTYFAVRNYEQYAQIQKYYGTIPDYVTVELDLLQLDLQADELQTILEELKNSQRPTFAINAYALQQFGANTWQEIAGALTIANDYIGLLLEHDFTIDEAAACLQFNCGVGANYFFELSKIRALRRLYYEVIKAYQPEHNCTYNCRIIGITGFLNKSLRDPYTNLLRQTTEAMALTAGGVDGIAIQPYNLYSSDTSSHPSRMALNISSIIKEESFLDKVIDPYGGSYTVALLTDKIAEKTWGFFQKLEEKGGVFEENGQQLLRDKITATAKKRIAIHVDKKKILIGVNDFLNDSPSSATWKIKQEYLGLHPLILENEISA